MLDLEHSTDEYRCYTNLNKKDGRIRCVLVYKDGHKENISHPKLLMEQFLGRKLLPTEQVHHIDENPLNNEISNLQIIPLGEHQRMHNPSRFIEYEVTCAWCGKKFTMTYKHHCNHRKGRDYFCSKICSGKYGASKQKEQSDRDI